jgi:hypothetical protein
MLTSSLTGRNKYNPHNLSGKSFLENPPSIELNKVKMTIFNTILLPIISKQWRKLDENLFTIDKIKNKIDLISRKENIEDLVVYKDILKAVEVIVAEHKQLDELEKTIYGSANDVSTMVFKTAMIRLKPEYEIYDMIFGRPNRNKLEQYDEKTINRIIELLKKNDITFDKIKEAVMSG